MSNSYCTSVWDGDECVARETRYQEALTGPASRYRDLVRLRYQRVHGITPHIPEWSERERGTRPIKHWHYDGVYPVGVDQIQYCKAHSECEPILDLDKVVEHCGLKSCLVCGGGVFVVFYKKQGSRGDRLRKLTWGGKHHRHDPNLNLHIDEFAQARYNHHWNKKVEVSRPGQEHTGEGVVSNYSGWSSKPINKPFDDTYLLHVAEQMDHERHLLARDRVPMDEAVDDISLAMGYTQQRYHESNPSIETTHDTANELHQARKALEVLRLHFNKEGLSWYEVTVEQLDRIRCHPDIKALVLKWKLIHGGSMGNDNAEHKRHERANARVIEMGRGDYYEFDQDLETWLDQNHSFVYGDPTTLFPSGYHALVRLDNKFRLYDLGVSDEWEEKAAETAFEDVRTQVLQKALRNARHRGRDLEETRKDINDAFDLGSGRAEIRFIESRFCGPDCSHCHDKAAVQPQPDQEVPA